MLNKKSGFSRSGISGMDMSFVMFFLALEFGRGSEVMSLDGAIMGITLLMVLILPFFLTSSTRVPSFSNWLLGRSVLAGVAFLFGIGISRSAGTLLPEAIGSLPMTFLILASIVSCYVRFCGLTKLRQAN